MWTLNEYMNIQRGKYESEQTEWVNETIDKQFKRRSNLRGHRLIWVNLKWMEFAIF